MHLIPIYSICSCLKTVIGAELLYFSHYFSPLNIPLFQKIVPLKYPTFRHVTKGKLCHPTMFGPASTSRVLSRSGPMASLGPLKFTFCSNPEGAQTLRSKLDLKPVPSSTIKQNTSLSLLSSMEVMAPLPLRGKSAGLMERAHPD